MQLQIDLDEGLERKRRGLARVERKHFLFVEAARHIARRLARQFGTVTSDQVREEAARGGLAPQHPNAWGAVFKSGEFVRVGEAQSKLASANGRRISVWRLREGEQ